MDCLGLRTPSWLPLIRNMALSVTSLCCLSDRLTLTWLPRKSSSVSSPLGANSFCSVMCFCLLYLQFAARVSCTIVSKPHVTELDLGWVFHRYRLLVTFQLSGAWRVGAVWGRGVQHWSGVTSESFKLETGGQLLYCIVEVSVDAALCLRYLFVFPVQITSGEERQ